jgi:hypothetical protein
MVQSPPGKGSTMPLAVTVLSIVPSAAVSTLTATAAVVVASSSAALPQLAANNSAAPTATLRGHMTSRDANGIMAASCLRRVRDP